MTASTLKPDTPKIERVIYWAMYFRLIHALSRNYNNKFSELWWGNSNTAPSGILKSGMDIFKDLE